MNGQKKDIAKSILVEPNGYIFASGSISFSENEKMDITLTKLETDHAAASIHFSEAVHMGFIDPEGEVCRTILMKEDLDLFELNQIMPSIIFDSYKIK